MGFKLGRIVGSVASGAVRTASGGAIRPSFSTSQKPDSTVTTVKGAQVAGLPFGTQTAVTKTYYSPTAGAACPVGFRLNKSAYVTRGGGTSHWPKQLQLHQAKSTCVKRRKINAGNGRAATRAVRRLVSFYRLSQRVAKQLRRAASAAHIRGGRRGRALPGGRGSVEVVNVE